MARLFGHFAKPDDLLPAFAVASNPFQLGFTRPCIRYRRGWGKLERSRGTDLQPFLDRFGTRGVPLQLRRASSVGAAVGIEMPKFIATGRMIFDFANSNLATRLRCDGMKVRVCETHGFSGLVPATAMRALGKSKQVPTDPGTVIDDRLVAGKPRCLVAGDPQIRGLLQAHLGEEHLRRQIAKLYLGTEPQLDLLQQEPSSVRRHRFSQPIQLAMDRVLVVGEFLQVSRRFVAGEPLIISKVCQSVSIVLPRCLVVVDSGQGATAGLLARNLPPVPVKQTAQRALVLSKFGSPLRRIKEMGKFALDLRQSNSNECSSQRDSVRTMASRLLGVPVLLAAAVGVPYVASNGINIDDILPSKQGSQVVQPAREQDVLGKLPGAKTRPTLSAGPGETLYPSGTPVEGMTVMSLSEVINFNVTKEWVYQNWSRKSTALSDLGLFGVRVPLVTGTQIHDLAGSLTYFFGNDGRVHRISFHGTTGDTTQVVMLAAQQYGLRPQGTAIAGEQLFQIRRENQVFSELRTRPAPVLWSSSPHDSFKVDLDLQHPGVKTPLPSRNLPLPAFKASPVPPQQQLASQAQTANTKRVVNAKPATAKVKKQPEVDPRQKWEAFFPRSRVPKKQVPSLDRRDQIW